jgi:hypothetical protein
VLPIALRASYCRVGISLHTGQGINITITNVAALLGPTEEPARTDGRRLDGCCRLVGLSLGMGSAASIAEGARMSGS